jgi:hypothetical protein
MTYNGTNKRRLDLHSITWRAMSVKSLKGGSPNSDGTRHGNGKSWPVPSQDDGWSVCGTHGMVWQMVVPLLLLTGAGAVLAASFSPLVEARYVMPAFNTHAARSNLVGPDRKCSPLHLTHFGVSFCSQMVSYDVARIGRHSTWRPLSRAER